MAICPKCRGSYAKDLITCPECSVALVKDDLMSSKSSGNEYPKIQDTEVTSHPLIKSSMSGFLSFIGNVFAYVLYFAIPLTILYFIVRFIKWAWMQ